MQQKVAWGQFLSNLRSGALLAVRDVQALGALRVYRESGHAPVQTLRQKLFRRELEPADRAQARRRRSGANTSAHDPNIEFHSDCAKREIYKLPKVTRKLRIIRS